MFSSSTPNITHTGGLQEEIPPRPSPEPPLVTPPPCVVYQECETASPRTLQPPSPGLPRLTRGDPPPRTLSGLLTPNRPQTAKLEELEEFPLDQSLTEASLTSMYPRRQEVEAASSIKSTYKLPGPAAAERTRIIHRGSTRSNGTMEACVCTWEAQNLLAIMTKIIDLKPEVFTAIAPTSSKSFQLTEWLSFIPASSPDAVVRTKICYDFNA